MRKVLAGVLAGLVGLTSCSPDAALAQSYASIAKATTAAASSLIAKDSSGYLAAVNVVTGATAGYIEILDSATVPASGSAVTPLRCMPIAANTGIDLDWRTAPLRVGAGGVILFSSGASCFTYTASATAFIAADVQ